MSFSDALHGRSRVIYQTPREMRENEDPGPLRKVIWAHIKHHWALRVSLGAQCAAVLLFFGYAIGTHQPYADEVRSFIERCDDVFGRPLLSGTPKEWLCLSPTNSPLTISK